MAKTDTRIRILRAGAELIHKRGYTATGLSDILAASSVPKGSFYHYYGSKEGFALDAVDFHLGFLVSWIGEALSAETSPLGPIERLRRYFEQYRDYLGQQGFDMGCPIGNLAGESGVLSKAFREKLRDAFVLMQEPIEVCLTEARRTGELPSGMDPQETAEFILNSWEGALIRMKVQRDDKPLRAFERMVFDRLLRRQE